VAYFNGENPFNSFKLNFTPNTLGCYGMKIPKIEDFLIQPFSEAAYKNMGSSKKAFGNGE